MASTDPSGFQPPISIVARGALDFQVVPELRQDDITRVRRYCRVAAVLKSLTLFLLVLLVAWLLDQWLDTPWLDGGSPRLLLVATLFAAARFVLSELRLRTYDIRLADGAVSYTYGRRHAYLPVAHLQFIDTETSPLLKPMGLSRCVLHTTGEMLIISPVPVRFVSAIEHSLHEQRAGRPNAS